MGGELFEPAWIAEERRQMAAHRRSLMYPRCDLCGEPCNSGKVVEITTKHSTLHYCENCTNIADAEYFYLGDESEWQS